MLLLLAMTHALFPLLRSTTSKFFTLSYHNPKTGLYQTGADDFKYVFTWIVIFTGLRAGTMDNVLIPWARSVGIQKKKQRIRFAEQAWLIVFYSVFWSIGVVCSSGIVPVSIRLLTHNCSICTGTPRTSQTCQPCGPTILAPL